MTDDAGLPMGEAGSSEEPVRAVVGSTRKRTHRPQPRKRNVNVRFDEVEYGLIAVAAGRAGVSATAFVGIAAVAAAAGTEVPGSPIREALGELNQARTAAVRIGVAVNKLAAQALSVGGVTPAQLTSAADAARRAVATLDDVAGRVGRVLR